MPGPRSPQDFHQAVRWIPICSMVDQSGTDFSETLPRNEAFTMRARFHEWRKKIPPFLEERVQALERALDLETGSNISVTIARWKAIHASASGVICRIKEHDDKTATITYTSAHNRAPADMGDLEKFFKDNKESLTDRSELGLVDDEWG